MQWTLGSEAFNMEGLAGEEPVEETADRLSFEESGGQGKMLSQEGRCALAEDRAPKVTHAFVLC